MTSPKYAALAAALARTYAGRGRPRHRARPAVISGRHRVRLRLPDQQGRPVTISVRAYLRYGWIFDLRSVFDVAGRAGRRRRP